MKKYDNFEDSGVDWIGNIPGEWRISKLKFVTAKVPFPIVDGPFGTQLKADEYQESGIPLVRISNLDYNCNLTLEDIKFISNEKAEEIKRSAIRLNDIIIGKTGATIGKSGLNDKIEFGIISSSCLKISIDEKIINPYFFKYFVISNNFQKIILQTASGSTRDTINITPMANLEVVIPSLSEQTQIASFLDYKTNLIDATIEKKKRLIELLKEKRQAVINEAVTKGLNPNAPMKDSGVEWLGDIPEHWEVKKLKLHLDFLNNIRVPIDSSERFDRQGEYPYYGASGIIDYVDDYLFDGKYILIGEDGANILSRSTPLAFIAEGKFWVNNHAHILAVPIGVLEYFCYQLELNDYTPIASGSAQPKLTKDAIANLKIFIPPVKEQIDICNYINEITNRIDLISSNIEIAIEKLQTYRQSLISEAVTGKIDVRDWQAKKKV